MNIQTNKLESAKKAINEIKAKTSHDDFSRVPLTLIAKSHKSSPYLPMAMVALNLIEIHPNDVNKTAGPKMYRWKFGLNPITEEVIEKVYNMSKDLTAQNIGNASHANGKEKLKQAKKQDKVSTKFDYNSIKGTTFGLKQLAFIGKIKFDKPCIINYNDVITLTGVVEMTFKVDNSKLSIVFTNELGATDGKIAEISVNNSCISIHKTFEDSKNCTAGVYIIPNRE